MVMEPFDLVFINSKYRIIWHVTFWLLVMLPFVENSFKHGVGKQRNKAWINIKLIAQESQLEFQVRNSLSVSKTLTERPASGGIGLVNVSKRLILIYPNKHSLSAERQDEAYYVKLKLNITI